MNQVIAQRVMLVVLGVVIAGVLTDCAGRRITTSVEDQTVVQGQPPQAVAPLAETEKIAPPLPLPVEAPSAAPEQAVHITKPPIAPPSASTSEQGASLAPAVAERSLSDVYFDFDQFLIRRDAETILEADARQLKTNGPQKILIEGYCDERGTSAYNLVLGERRAQAAKRHLQNLGVAASQLQIISYGKERPFCTEHSEVCWQSNRRAHFRQP